MRLPATAILTAAFLTFGLPLPASADLLVTVDTDAQRMTVTVDGQARHAWPVSTGLARFETPTGAYRPFRMARRHVSREFDDAPMPNAIFFTGRGHAIHGTNHTRRLGSPASHGCVRLSPQHAAALYSLVTAQGMANTRVVIAGSGSLLASGRGDGTRSRSRGNPGASGLMSAGMQMGRETPTHWGAPSPVRRAHRPSDRYDAPDIYGPGDAYGLRDEFY
ncbi:L,D-transpeptidase [Methylobacterium flocculans]|uniref:L,D-transpeptidase n=1 Tax=Methylobacterium flocculans TaxID=2984843 RepID=UPI0021F39ACC|nr:L,D-transpeptidase [Methylobacterium sp. FF17]